MTRRRTSHRAWGEAYALLADVLIAREKTIYEEHAAAPGGWTDWRDFTVGNTQPESDIIRSFRLRPVDGGPVMRHRPGQYLTFTLDLPEHGRLKRNYSISSGPEDTSYRITVKREAEPGVPRGIVSNWLHDHADSGAALKVAPPAGEFYLDEESQRPVVLLSGGVGLTRWLACSKLLSSLVRADRPGSSMAPATAECMRCEIT